jgi:prepilin-type N-terminal cleavage/methylation domain-containing protein
MAKFKNKGFTLVELLVVIAIIGLLASIVLVSLNSARAKARDARRKADLHQIAIALEMYASEYGGYPSSAWPNVDYKIFNSLALEPKMANFLSVFPIDPIAGGICYDNQYLYISNIYNDGSGTNASATRWVLYATLEDQSTTNLSTIGIDAWLRAGNGSCDPNRGVPNYRLGDYN